MLIILEGIDCSGKDWLADRLLKAIPNCFSLKHGMRPKNKAERDMTSIQASYNIMLKTYIEVIDMEGGNCLFNRFYPSELVYSGAMRNYDAFLPPYSDFYNNLERRVCQIPHFLVYVDASEEVITERMVARGDEHITIKDISKLAGRYTKFLNQTQLNTIRVVSSFSAIELITNIVKEGKLK